MKNSKYTISEIQAKSILQHSGLPGVAYVVNPYTGCRFGCKYCYAYFVGRFRHPSEEWGSYVDAKLNAPELLKKELLAKLGKNKKKDLGEIFFSSVTDPYQGIEAKYLLTRQCLSVLADLAYQGKVTILTKSSLVTRDIDVFTELYDLEVGITVTSTGDPITRYLETFAPPNEDRLKALVQLHKAGIKTYAFIGPLLPHFVWKSRELDNLFKQLKSAGISYLYVEHLNLAPYIRDRLETYLTNDHPELIDKFRESCKPEYREKLDHIIYQLTKKYNLPLGLNQTIYHKDKTTWRNLQKT